MDGERILNQRWMVIVAVVLVAVMASVPSAGTLGAGLISDDGAVLGYLHRAGAFSDWMSPEYDLRSFRFWRPLVSTSLGLQLQLTGVDPLPMRLFNLAGHIATALLAMTLARQLGARLWAATWIGCLVGLFPYQGGTVTWIVGRVDSQCVPFVMGALSATLSGLRGRALLAGTCLFLALASKEVALVTPIVAGLLVWARGRLREEESLPSAGRSLLCLGLVLAGCLVWRRLALGVWGGGYPGGVSASFPDGIGFEGLGRVLGAAVRPEVWLLSALALGLGMLLARRMRGSTALLVLVVAGGLGAAPLVGNLASGDLTEYHVRTLMLADGLLCVALAAWFAGQRPKWMLGMGAVCLLALSVQRGRAAWADTHEWAAAASVAEGFVAANMKVLQDANQASPRPVLSAAAPNTLAGAYVLKWGLADRFRAPFPKSPRPVWPWRLVHELTGPERLPASAPRQNLRWPFDASLRTVPPIVVTQANGRAITDVEVTANLINEPGLIFHCAGAFPGARFEVLLFTELGYALGLYGGAPQVAQLEAVQSGPVPAPFGGQISLRSLLTLDSTGLGSGPSSVLLWQVLALAADFGATEAYVELRAVDDARGERNRPVAASQWIRLFWKPELRDVLLPKEQF